MKRNTLGEVLKKRRQAMGMSQQELAELLNVRASHVGYLEQGRRGPSLSLLSRIAEILGIDKADLLLMARPETKEFLDNQNEMAGDKHNAWDELVSDKALLTRHRITPEELKVLSQIGLLGTVSSSRDYLFILKCIRQAVEE